MNSYGDPSSARGRVSVPGLSSGYGSEADWPGNDSYADDRPGGPAGRASVPSGRASASVPAGRASAGRAPVARAAVPGTGYGGYDSDYAAEGPSAPAHYDSDYGDGRGSVGTAVAGRATVGRASVRPISPAVGGPAGPGGPGGRGPGGRGPGGRGPGGMPASAKAKRRRRINWIIGMFAVFIMLAGGTVVGVTYYSTTVTLPSDFAAELELSSSLLYAGGKQEIAKLGTVNRVYAKIDQIPDFVQHAVASAEDRKFYEHEGIDYIGIMRAAWNNFTGGDQQGASTITQQYARNAMKLTDVTYARKAKEAVLASKLNDQFTKEEIMEFYLNTIYFGRGAYSVESAAQAYFKKSVDKLTVAEAAVIAAVIKQPVPSDTHKGYDPALNPEAAKDRWNYVLDGMAEKGWLPEGANRATLEYPKVQPWDDKNACGLECGLNKPAGNVINYVTQELAEMVDVTTGKKICQPGTCMEAIRTGGFRITTSINPTIQKAAEHAAWRKDKDSLLAGQPANLMAALVAVEPSTGRVLAYFGGEKSSGHDYAGRNWENNQWTGGHPPGSSFKVYTLAAALKNNISLQSHWDAREIKAGNPNGDPPVENAGRTPDCGQYCTLAHSTLKSYNVPFFYVTKEIGVGEVLETAKAAGITMMWDNDLKPYDLLTTKTEDVDRKVFDYQIGFGQYGITVLDHANGLATLANRGTYNKAHFVVSVEKKNRQSGKYEQIAGEQRKPQKDRIPRAVADDVTSALQPIASANGANLRGGRESAAKTGTWQYAQTKFNAHAWTVGYTPQIAAAVWVGNAGKEKPIKMKNGESIGGGSLPADIWQKFMNEAHEGKDKKDLPDAVNIGDDSAGNGKSPEPKKPDCLVPFLCPDNNGNGNDGNGNGGNNGGNEGPGNNLPGLPPNPGLPDEDND
jgi:membrane peptidoglycan carboxypeptidase